jgi:hypothetical protein
MIKNIPDLKLQKTGRNCWTIIYLNGHKAVGEVYRPFPEKQRIWVLFFRGEDYSFSTRTEALEHVQEALDPVDVFL